VPDELKQKKRGRKKVYSPELLLAVIIAKGDLSFSGLSKKLKEKGFKNFKEHPVQRFQRYTSGLPQ